MCDEFYNLQLSSSCRIETKDDVVQGRVCPKKSQCVIGPLRREIYNSGIIKAFFCSHITEKKLGTSHLNVDPNESAGKDSRSRKESKKDGKRIKFDSGASDSDLDGSEEKHKPKKKPKRFRGSDKSLKTGDNSDSLENVDKYKPEREPKRLREKSKSFKNGDDTDSYKSADKLKPKPKKMRRHQAQPKHGKKEEMTRGNAHKAGPDSNTVRGKKGHAIDSNIQLNSHVLNKKHTMHNTQSSHDKKHGGIQMAYSLEMD